MTGQIDDRLRAAEDHRRRTPPPPSKSEASRPTKPQQVRRYTAFLKHGRKNYHYAAPDVRSKRYMRIVQKRLVAGEKCPMMLALSKGEQSFTSLRGRRSSI